MAKAPTTEFIRRFLVAAELDRYAKFIHHKRKSEWLGGRLAAKYAALKLRGQWRGNDESSQSWRAWAVLPDGQGRPFLHNCHAGGGQAPPRISISHSSGYAVAMAADHKPCGIDIQSVTPTVIRLRERYSFPSEWQVLEKSFKPAADHAERLTLLWAAKEAVKKAFAVGPGDLHLFRAVTDDGGTEKSLLELHYKKDGVEKKVKAGTMLFDGYAFAFTADFDEL